MGLWFYLFVKKWWFGTSLKGEKNSHLTPPPCARVCFLYLLGFFLASKVGIYDTSTDNNMSFIRV